jgi:WD40 repeat protein
VCTQHQLVAACLQHAHSRQDTCSIAFATYIHAHFLITYIHAHFLIVYAHRYIASGGDDGAAIVWDITTGKQIAALQSATASSTTAADTTIDAVAFSADSAAVAIGSRDCTVKVCKPQQAGIVSYEQHQLLYMCYTQVIIELQLTACCGCCCSLCEAYA